MGVLQSNKDFSEKEEAKMGSTFSNPDIRDQEDIFQMK